MKKSSHSQCSSCKDSSIQEGDDETLSRELLSCHPSLHVHFTQQKTFEWNDDVNRHTDQSLLYYQEEEEEEVKESSHHNKAFHKLKLKRVPFQLTCLILLSILSQSLAFTLNHSRNSFTTSYSTSYSTSSHASFTTLHVKQKEKEATLIQPVQPLQTSSKEKRLSVEKAWEQAKLLSKMEEQTTIENTTTTTPYLDLFQQATQKTDETTSSYDINSRPKGRPESVAGAMSRTTLLNLNEVETRLAKESTKRKRGRPRKIPTTEIDEITSIAAKEKKYTMDTSTTTSQDPSTPKRKSRVKILPKRRKLKESELEGETTGMMPLGGATEPPNLQKYYRTTLLTQEEEYRLGMKIQFLIQCEAVHEGLYNQFGRLPSVEEWANACGFTETENTEVDRELERQIRPIQSEAWEEDTDPNMFVGNGLVNDSGPGRGRGRAKKAPPTFLKDYYDDSDIKFSDVKVKKKDQMPMNRGTPSDFVEIMLTSKEAKQKMVQCNMRLVVSISKRYKHVGVNVADLVQEGSIGLTRAAEKFDPKKGFKFSTYASW